MSLPINIKDLLYKQKIESNRIEFKKGWNPDKIYHSICAFANDFDNIGGGYIVVGVEEDENGMPIRPVIGIPPEQLDNIQKDMVGYNNKIDPYYMPRTSIEEIDNRCVFIIWVPSGANRPYSVKERVTATKVVPSKWYIRNGSSSIEAKGEVLDELRDMASRVPFDDRGNQNIKISDISPALVLDYLQTVDSKLAAKFNVTPLIDILSQMDLVVGPTENRLLKNVAAMMFCKNPEKFFPVTQVDLVIFPEGCTQNPNNMIEVPPITGPVPEMIGKTLNYLKTNVIKQYISKPKNQPESITFYNYPYQAFEEAVVNAFYHRDYSEREPIEINIEPDMVSILSYSGPDRSISMEAIKRGERLKSRRYRNRRLGDFLKELRLSEGRATGIPTIQDELRKNGSKPARIETDENRSYFLIEIPCRKNEERTSMVTDTKTLTDKELRVMTIVQANSMINRKELSEKTGYSISTITRIINVLSSDLVGLIKRQGSKRDGGYILTDLARKYLDNNV